MLEKGVKFEKEKELKDFNSANVFSKASEYIIADHIGNLIDYDAVTLYPRTNGGDADLQFVDSDVYYAQIKTPQFFQSQFAGRFERLTQQFYDNYDKSKSEFSIGTVINDELSQQTFTIEKKGRKASFGILAYPSANTPQTYIMRKIKEMMFKTNDQLGKITNKGVKIFLLDSTHHYTYSNKLFCDLIKKIYNENKSNLRNTNCFALHSYQLPEDDGNFTESSIFPIYLDKDVQTRAFLNEICLYNTTMLSFPMFLQGGKEWSLSIKDGNVYIDDQLYGPFWDIINDLQRLNHFVSHFSE